MKKYVERTEQVVVNFKWHRVTKKDTIPKGKMHKLIDIFNHHPYISNRWQILKNEKPDSKELHFEFDDQRAFKAADAILELVEINS